MMSSLAGSNDWSMPRPFVSLKCSKVHRTKDTYQVEKCLFATKSCKFAVFLLFSICNQILIDFLKSYKKQLRENPMVSTTCVLKSPHHSISFPYPKLERDCRKFELQEKILVDRIGVQFRFISIGPRCLSYATARPEPLGSGVALPPPHFFANLKAHKLKAYKEFRKLKETTKIRHI